MPKVKSLKPSRQLWSEENMREAVENVQKKKMGWKLASKTFNVPSTTLRRRVGRNTGYKKGDLGGCRLTFSKEIENEIISHITNMETRFLGLTTLDVRSLAYQVAEQNHIPHKFNRTTEKTEWAWLHQFIKRNPTIILQTQENTFAARAQARAQAKAVENTKQQKERAKLARAEKRESLKLLKNQMKRKMETKKTQMNFEDADDEDDVACLYCNELFSWSNNKSKEIWLKCQLCGKWAHAPCAGKDPKTKNFTCQICE